jgi:hypothetical protein
MRKGPCIIGDSFPTTESGGVLTVIGEVKVHNKIMLELTCSLCSKDKELFPLPFKVTKGELLKGRVPCGCSTHPKLSNEQYLIKINRVCQTRNYHLVSTPKEDIKAKSRVTLRCNRDGRVWSPQVSPLLSGVGCKTCAIKESSKLNIIPDDIVIQSFIKTGNFLEGTQFSRNTDKDKNSSGWSYFDVVCPVCSVDEFVANKVCSGVFTSSAGDLRRGRIPCRCSKSYRFTHEERCYQISKLLREEGHTFIGFKEGEYKNSLSIPVWKCNKGHVCDTTTTANLTLKGIRCGICSTEALKLQTREPAEDIFHSVVESGRLPKGSRILREYDKGAMRRLVYYCAKCSVDDFVHNEVCTGEFDIILQSLKGGGRSCRCSKGCRYTQKQLEYKISLFMNKLGGTLIELPMDSCLYKDRRVIVQHSGSTWDLNLNSLLCGGFSSTYFTGRSNVYLVLWELDQALAIKVGMTKKEPHRRARKQSSLTKFEVVGGYVFENVDNAIARSLEYELKSKFGGRYLSKMEFPDGYTETYNPLRLEDMLSYIKDRLGIDWVPLCYKSNR